jgi:maltose alpha-D-glucosyltransferase/alpha-amylase
MELETSDKIYQCQWKDSLEDTVFIQDLVEDILPKYLVRCRWFAGKSDSIKQFSIDDFLVIETSLGPAQICIIEIINAKGNAETYLVPLSFLPEAQRDHIEEPTQSVICEVSFEKTIGCLVESTSVEPFRKAIFEFLVHGAKLGQSNGQLIFHKGKAFKKDAKNTTYRNSRILGAEQSNTTVVYNDQYYFKFYRRLFINPNPDYELSRFLTENAGFKNTPKYAGSLSWKHGKLSEITLGLCQERVENQGDAWDHMVGWVNTYFQHAEKDVSLIDDIEQLALYDPVSIEEVPSIIRKLTTDKVLQKISTLGVRTAEMHVALASDKNNRII